jgi:spermidine synthase
VAGLFLVSGAAGLLYEVLWARQLALVLGGAYPAVVAVVTTFLAGLAVGAGLGGRWAERTARPLRLYALLEACVGAWGLAFPLLLAAAEPVLGWCYRAFGGNPVLHPAASFAVAAALLLPPTVAMGATLPVLVRAVVRTPGGVLGGTGLLYGLNTMGAAGGALVTGFVLLPGLGLRGTLLVGVAANLCVAATAFLLDRRAGPAPAPEGPEDGSPAADGHPGPAAGVRRALLAVAAGSGFAAMLCQMGWTKALILFLGSSVHAFTLIVAAFILGLGAGGLLSPLLGRGGRARLLALVALEAIVGAGAWATVGSLAALPVEVVGAVEARAGDFGAVLAWEWWTVLGIVALPTAAMGAAFPLLVAALAEGGGGGAARSVGRVYAWNTAGTILGALGGGMLLVPALGIRGALLAATVVNLGLASLLAAAALRRPVLRAAAALVLLGGAGGLVAAAPPWPPERIHCGSFLYGSIYQQRAEAQGKDVARVLRDSGWDTLFSREGRSATVGVLRSFEGMVFLRINGKTDASTGPDMATQVLLGQLPALAHPHPRSAMVVGLASGVSAAAVASHGLDRVDVLEISPEVLEASRFFDGVNGGVTRRPEVRVVLEDGRRHMEHARETYDVIVSEPSNPWIAGVSNLFTVEYFRACRERLSGDGVLCVWLQAYSIPEEDFRMVVRTVRSVFPGLTVWECGPYQDYILLAPRDDAADLVARVAARGLPAGPVAENLALAGIRGPGAILGLLFAGREATGRIAGEGPLHTDDRLQLEFDTPRCLFGKASLASVAPGALDGMRESPSAALAVPGVDADAVRRAVEARAAGRKAYLVMDAATNPAAQGRWLDQVLADPAPLRDLAARMPRSLGARTLRAAARRETLEALAAPILWSRAIEDLEAALRGNPTDLWPAELLTQALVSRGEFLLVGGAAAEAERDFLRARDLQPGNAVPWYAIACARYDESGGDPESPRIGAALEALEKCLAIHPHHEEALTLRGAALALRKDDARAEEAFRKALQVRPDSTRALANFAKLRLYQGRRGEARELVRCGLTFEPRNPDLLSVQKEAGGE